MKGRDIWIDLNHDQQYGETFYSLVDPNSMSPDDDYMNLRNSKHIVHTCEVLCNYEELTLKKAFSYGWNSRDYEVGVMKKQITKMQTENELLREMLQYVVNHSFVSDEDSMLADLASDTLANINRY